MVSWALCWLAATLAVSAVSGGSPSCGGVLTARTGVISTPGFPAAFPTPLHCEWVIAKSDADINASIVVYLTQVFVTSGLSFMEYLYYEHDYKLGEREVHVVSESSATHVKWLQVNSPYLAVTLNLNRLEGHHLRALPALLDVFGFNITYEISSASSPVKPYQCNTIECRFLGHCYANHNYSEYGCSCFPGYSGKDCGEGPLCLRHGRPTCHNGGTCRQMGAAAVSCDCPPGYTGDLCELPILEPAGCEDGSCVLECPYDGNPANACNCNGSNAILVTPDRMRFEAVLKLSDRPPVTPELQQQMTTFLRGLNLSKDIEVINISSDGTLWLQAWGENGDGAALQAALSRLQRLASHRLTAASLRFDSEPALFLQTVAVNQRPVVWEGAEFILSCEAQGAPYMTFKWFKDGVTVNVTKATRNSWLRLVRLEGTEDRWTALLGVKQAARPDAGLFRCQVAARGRQQCRALRLHVLAPEVRLVPMSVTLHKGENVSLTCLSANSGGLHGKLGYSWTRNKALFPLAPGSAVWEDLAPAGSILHLYNVQKSGEYSCHVSSGAIAPRTQSVYVRTVDRGSEAALCPGDQAYGLRWPSVAPGNHLQECPQGYTGHAVRSCEMKNAPFESEWNIPDFSNCMADGLTDIYNEFQRITFGYGNTSTVGILRRYLSWVLTRPWLLPGEGGTLLRLSRAVLRYLVSLHSSGEKDEAMEPFFKIVNKLLKSEHAVLEQQNVLDLQEAVEIGAALGGGASLRLSEIAVHSDIIRLGSVVYHTEFPFRNVSHSRWDKENVEIYLDPLKSIMTVPNKLIIMFITYKNLTNYYTSLYYSAEVKEGDSLEYWLASRIVAIKLTDAEGGTFPIPSGKLTFKVHLQHSTPIPRTRTEGDIVCGKYKSGGWLAADCKVSRLASDITQCDCQDEGMYALLLARQSTPGGGSEHSGGSEVVAGALGGGALGVLLSGLLLLPGWLRRRCCLVYLKLHYCFTTSMALGLMLYCLTSDWCGNMSGGWLELLLLGGGAALVAQLLLLHAELAWPAPPPPHLPRTILMLMTGVCVLAALCSRAAGGGGWGLKVHTTPLNVFAAASALLAALHFLLCACVAARLRLLATKLPDRNNYIQKRMGLMRRSAAIFLCSKAVEVASVFHYNIPSPATTNALAATAALLGFVVFCCYILKDETSRGLKRLLRPKEIDWDCSSDYANTSLSFFIKQGCEAESRSAPGAESAMPLAQQPPQHWRTPPTHSHHSAEHRERLMGKQADIVKSVEFKNVPPECDSPERSAESSLGGAVSSVCDLVPSCATSMPSTEPTNTHPPQEYVTRVCVELGILSRSAPPPGPPEQPILLCSVDFEPYSDHKYDLTGMDTADNCVLCIGKPKVEAIEVQTPAPIKSCLKNKEVHPIYCKEVPPKESPVTESEDDSQIVSDADTTSSTQPESSPVPTTDANKNPNIDGMLDLISHDLDYLLNRTAAAIPPAVPNCKQHSRHPSGDGKNFTALDKIQEENP